MFKNKTVCVIIVAAGSSSRMGFDKLMYKFNGKTVFEHSLHAFENHNYIDEIIVVAGENYNEIEKILKNCKSKHKQVKGGATRCESVKNGVMLASSHIIAIHDAARPFVSEDIISNAIEKAAIFKAAAPAVPVKDTVKIADENGIVKSTPQRKNLYAVQTPQCFFREEYIDILHNFYSDDLTDDCSLYEKAQRQVVLTMGDYNNIKITTIEDLPTESAKKERDSMSFRIGHGYDVHKLVAGRKLILGGVDIAHETGLLGHSDADVLAHAITDAVLGAACMGDIGKLFPDTDEKYKGANSILLLENVAKRLFEQGYKVENIDSTIVCQAPKLAPFIDDMRKNLASAMKMDIKNINVKATTEEGMGFTGEKMGIAAHAVCILSAKNK